MACKVATVKDLRLFLDSLEDAWTEEDDTYLGKFEDTPLRVYYDGEDINNGYGPAYIEYDITGLGLIIDRPEELDASDKTV